MEYNPVKTKFESASEETQKLIKRKRALEFGGSTAEEWLDLAEAFLADDGRANYAYCMWQYKKCGGVIPDPVPFDVPEPETSDSVDYTDI
jgi:hypothetical protein